MSSSHLRSPLPRAGDRYVTDAGLETELVFHDGFELPHFISATLVEDEVGHARLERYYRSFVALAEEQAMGVLLETPTWRISADWSPLVGYDRDGRRRLNARATELLSRLREQSSLPRERFVVSGNIGPRFDGYAADRVMSIDEATRYHHEQVGDLVAAGVDAISCLTITTSSEAAGIARAANAYDVPVAVHLTVETDGRLPSGEPLGEAFERVDEEARVAYFGINCAHPRHFRDVLGDAPWVERIGSLRANASTKSHAELDGCETLDDGDPQALAGDYASLLARLPGLRVFGGCCGTDLRHVRRICDVVREAGPNRGASTPRREGNEPRRHPFEGESTGPLARRLTPPG